MTTNQTIFDIYVPLKRRNIIRLIIFPLYAILLIWLGIYLQPENVSYALEPKSISTWGQWGFFGMIFIGVGILKLVKEIVFAFQSWGASGGWKFRLIDHHLTWHVPNHSHGSEIGFSAHIEEIREIELRTIERHDEMRERQYWIHFYERESIQLQSYSGVTISFLTQKIIELGVKYQETFIE